MTFAYVMFAIAASILAFRAAVAVREWYHIRRCFDPYCPTKQAQAARRDAFLHRWAD